VNRDLHVELVGHREATDRSRRVSCPVLVQLEAERAGTNLFAQRSGRRRVALAEKSKVQGKRFPPIRTSGGFVHAPGVTSSLRSGRRTGAAADQGGDPGVERTGSVSAR